MRGRGDSIQRPGRSLDTQRLGQAVGYAGIDPRTWVSLAIVGAVNVAEDGPLADVQLIPSGLLATVRVGAPYAGSAWGFWGPLYADDEVLVAIPDGQPAHGGVIIARLWCAADVPPALAVLNPNDALLQAQPDKNLRLVAGGSGSVIIDASGTGAVEVDGPALNVNSPAIGLGQNPNQQVPLGNNLLDALTTFASACAGSTTDPVLKAAAGVLLQAFANPAAPMLSTVTKTE